MTPQRIAETLNPYFFSFIFEEFSIAEDRFSVFLFWFYSWIQRFVPGFIVFHNARHAILENELWNLWQKCFQLKNYQNITNYNYLNYIMVNISVQITCVVISFHVWKLTWKNFGKSQNTLWSVENGVTTTSFWFFCIALWILEQFMVFLRNSRTNPN